MNFDFNDYGLHTKEFDSLPFWSWNDKLEPEELRRQIRWMKNKNIGGFFMHARSGLMTKYLSDEWMQCVEICADEAERLGMQAWLYDENGWPSGFVGGKLLEDVENHDRFLTCVEGAYDSSALVSYLITEEKLVRLEEAQEGVCLNVYEHLSTSTADILNPKVVRKFLNLTHEQYKKRFGERFSAALKGFFTDEPQYYRWNVPYTVMVRDYFYEVLHEDILDGLGLLFLKKKGYRRFRYQYWRAMQQLMLNGFAKTVYNWCEQNGMQLTGHYFEEEYLAGQMLGCAGIMPFYQFEHIPGIDCLGRRGRNSLSSRQVLSVAKQFGKEKILCEIYAGCGWDVTPYELKTLTEFYYFNGINISCQHLLPYSERGNRIHDHPAHYSSINPWVEKYFDRYNSYFNKLGALLSRFDEQVRVAILHPIRSAYFDYDRRQEEEGCVSSIKALDDALNLLLDRLEDHGINFHFLDETLLSQYGSVKDNKLICGACQYDMLILPKCETMDASTEHLLRTYVAGGGRVHFFDGRPAFLEWEPFHYDYLKSNLSWEEILASRPTTFSFEGGKVCVSFRKNGETELYALLNRSETEESRVTIALPEGKQSFRRLFLKDEREEVIESTLILAPGESALLIPDDGTPISKPEFETVCPEMPYRIISCDENSLTIDRICYSADGLEYSAEQPLPMAFRSLLKSRYQGMLYVKYRFDILEIPPVLTFHIAMEKIENVYCNGIALTEEERKQGVLTGKLQAGTNELIVQITFTQNENVYRVLFDPEVTESMKNCLVYGTELEPLFLRGDFGVEAKSDFIPSEHKGVFLADYFAITHAKKQISSILKDGYPFFAGTMTLQSRIFCKGNRVKLHLPGRWHSAKVTVNKTNCGVALLSRSLDISDAVHEGENTITVEYTFGNRNLLGPHHFRPEPEPMMVGPDNFEFNDLEKPGHEDNYREEMAFVEPLCLDK